MTPTIEYVQSKIEEFNSLVFSSSLPPIPVKLSRSRTYLGRVQYMKKVSLFGRNITVRHKTSPGAVSPRETQIRPHIICISLLASGEWGITVCAKTKVFER